MSVRLSMLLALLACNGVLVIGEMFTAVVELKGVVVAETQIARALRVFTEREQKRINALNFLADNFEQHSLKALLDSEKYLSNPVNAFLVVKRFTTDWNDVLQKYILNNETTEDLLDALDAEEPHLPTDEDLEGITEALLRLQDTYALPTSRIANGDLHPGIEDTSTMSSDDCYEVGRQAYVKQDYYHTILWMREALRLLDITSSQEDYVDFRVDILDHIAFSTYQQGDIQLALNLTDQLLAYEPTHARALANRLHYESVISSGQQSVDSTVQVVTDKYRSADEFVDYERLCRGESTKKISSKGLSCRYLRHHPIFYINPLREEVLHIKPRIVFYHKAITDSEMARIRQMATPRLERATVQNPVTGVLEYASYRVSKSAWLKDWEDPVVHRVSDRAKAMANLTGQTVEELQVVNYGIGGHYEPHYDHARKSESNSFGLEIGNRIATFICYLTDVEAGGATVFNLVGASVIPEKGSCAIWYNLKRNGEGDMSTRHAACPVLVGSKWVMNKWFHERGEEFIRPCSLFKNK